MVSLNGDSDLWFAEEEGPSRDTLGPLCCWFVDCWS